MTDEVISWVDPAGVVTVLNDQPNMDVEWGVTGRFMPPVQYAEDEVPLESGARLRQTRVKPREVALPVVVNDTTPDLLRARLRSVMSLFNPLRGDGRLRVQGPDGTTRDLVCRYSNGFELEERFETVLGSQRTVLVLRAVDPFWYDSTATLLTFTTGTSTTFFPFFPMVLNSDSIIGSQTINNTGDVEAYPLWVVQGPSTSITLTNDTTGATISLPITLTSAQTVTIDTRPGHKTVLRNDGTNLYGSLSTASSLWNLPAGISQVSISLPGSSSASYVSLTYSRRYLTV